jgi:hypothetical protein
MAMLRLRAFVVGLAMTTLGVGCQAVFGDYHIDDSAFPAAAGDGSGGDGSGDGGTGNGSGAGTGARSGGMGAGMAGAAGDGEPVQTGPIQVMPTVGLYTTEWGVQASFSVVLTQAPTSDVVIGLTSDNKREGKITVDSLTFTKTDWNAPQPVVVTGVDDADIDGNQTYHIVTAPAKSDDKAFDGQDPANVTLTNIDNETAGITIAPTSGLVTSESGTSDTFTVVLNSAPKEDVTIDLQSSKPTEATVDPARLVFTDANWMAPQLVTVTGVDDSAKDKDQPYEIVTAPSKSKDPSYNGIDAADVSAVNLDDESAGVSVVLVSGMDPLEPTKLRTSESGDSATFTVELNAPPSDDVTIGLTSSVISEGTVSPASLTFTKDNWHAPQLVTVTGVEDDQTADGNQPYQVRLEPAVSKDLDYQGYDADDVSMVNIDNDKPGFTVMLLSGIDPKDPTKLLTTEAGASATFSIALNSKPTKDVTFKLSSSVTTEGSVSPGTLTFTQFNYNAPQIVTVKGVDDPAHDGNQPYYVRTAVATSGDASYVLDPPDVQVTNQDNDSPGVTVSLATGIDPTNGGRLVTGENGDSATFTVALTSQPQGDVTIALTSSKTTEGTVSPTTLKFTKANFNGAQTVTVKGANDDVADGNQPYAITLGAASSPDLDFNMKFGTQVQVTNRDDDSAGIIVTPTSGLTTGENGKTATFTIRLQSMPLKPVTIGLSSSVPSEGKPNVSSVTFTAANWNAPQTITVTGQQDDGTADGSQAYKIITDPPQSEDSSYGPSKMNPPDVSLTNLDDDSPGIIVTPTSGLVTSEDLTSATFTVALQSKPSNPVKINLSSSRPSEGTVSPSVLNFDGDNWRSPQLVTVTGVNDDSADGPQGYLIQFAGASSLDGNYNNLVGHDVSVTNVDNDSAGVRINPVPTATPAQTKEKSGTSTFTVRLNSLPTGPVMFNLTSSNPLEGTVSPAQLSFTLANWSSPQTVTVTGADETIADGDQLYKIQLSNGSSSDPNYNGKFGIDLPFINLDDDHPGYVVNAASDLKTSETGTSTTFTIKLLSQPKASVTVPLSSSNTSEGTVSPVSLDFTMANWATAQTVTVTGVNDTTPVADGPQPYTVLIGNAVSSDLTYKGLFGTTVSLTNSDDDIPGFVVNAASGLQTTEKGGTATFTVALLSSPSDMNTVSIGLTSSNVKEGTVSPSKLVFTAGATGNWQTPQTVTVTGVNDLVPVADGNATYSVQFAPAVSGDAGYAGKAPAAISLTNADDDVASVLVTPTSCSTSPGTTATFTLTLTSQPGDSVTIPLSSSNTNEGTVSPASVTFTIDNWNVAQTATVTGIDDMSMGASTDYSIVTGKAASPTDTTGYKNYDASDVSCVNTVPTPAMSPTP